MIESWRVTTTLSGLMPRCGYKHTPDGLCARVHRVAGFATSTGSAERAGAAASSQLTFDLGPLNEG